jgi:hypothetical protein
LLAECLDGTLLLTSETPHRGQELSFMPLIQPAEVPSGRAIQSIKVDSPPATPYCLSAVIVVPRGTLTQDTRFAVRRLNASDSVWFQTQVDFMARTDLHDYYEITTRVQDGSGTDFVVDLVSSDILAFEDRTDEFGGTVRKYQQASINADAWNAANFGDPSLGGGLAFLLQGQSRSGGNQTLSERAYLTYFGMSPFDPPQIRKMWTDQGRSNGYHVWGPLKRTLYKHIPMKRGGAYGYAHVYATVYADSPEIQYVVNFHNGVIEERRAPSGQPGGDIEDPLSGDLGTDTSGFGVSRAEDVIFTRLLVSGFSQLPPVEGTNGWRMTPYLKSGGTLHDTTYYENPAVGSVEPDTHALVRQMSASDLNRRHPLLLNFERCFRFSVHPTGTTPYANLVTGRCDWSLYGGWMFTPFGVPDLAAIGSSASGIDLSSKATTARTSLRTLTAYKADNVSTANGNTPQGYFLPQSWNRYGGETSLDGMWYDYGMKQAWDARQAGLDILYIEQLRVMSRTYGCMYYNLGGMPVNPHWHAEGGNAQWDRADRRFIRTSSGIKDAPFTISALRNPVARAQKILTADYNPGPTGAVNGQSRTPEDSFTQFGISGVPDWWAWGEIGTNGVGVGIPGSSWAVDLVMTTASTPGLRTSQPPPATVTDLGVTLDQSVPITIYVSDPSDTFDQTKSVTFQLTGTGEFDLPIVESVVVAGVSGGRAPYYSISSVGEFKTLTEIKVTALSGTFTGSEQSFFFGRAAQDVPEYFGFNGWQAMDDQHTIRQQPIHAALFLLTNDPVAKLYMWMNAMDARMRFWERGGAAFDLPFIDRGGQHGWAAVRDFAFAVNAWSQWMAVAQGHFNTDFGRQIVWDQSLPFAPNLKATFYAKNYVDVIEARFLNDKMSNGMYGSYINKNTKLAPYGNTNGNPNGDSPASVLHITAGREECYYTAALAAFTNIYIPPEYASTTGNGMSALKASELARSTSFKDFLWDNTPSAGSGYNIYMPSLVRRNPDGSPMVLFGGVADTVGTWDVYGPALSGLPEYNPVTGLAIHPLTYPTYDDDRYAVAQNGTSAQLNSGSVGAGTAFTLAANDSGASYATGALNGTKIPTPVVLIVSGTSFTNAKQRTFLVTGTGYVDGGANLNVGVITDTIIAQGNGGSTQFFSTQRHFVTVTEIKLIAGTNDRGSTVVGETFKFGTNTVGMQGYRKNTSGSLLEERIGATEDSYALCALATHKYLADSGLGSASDVNTLIQRVTSAASVPDAFTAMKSYTEYGGGAPVGRIEMASRMLWQLGHNSPDITLVADFEATASGAVVGPVNIGLKAKCIGKVTSYDWAITGPQAINKSGKVCTINLMLPGVYQVALTITGPAGTDTETKAAYITVS